MVKEWIKGKEKHQSLLVKKLGAICENYIRRKNQVRVKS
jgi:hypothetical protein